MHVRKGLIKNEVLFHKLNWALIPKPLRWSIKGRWRVIIAVNFQFKQLEGINLKNIRASTGFERVTSAIPVRCSTNWAVKPHLGIEVNLLSSYFPVQWNDVFHIYISHLFHKYFTCILHLFTFHMFFTFIYKYFTCISHLYFTSFHCTGRYELNKLTSLRMCDFTAQLV